MLVLYFIFFITISLSLFPLGLFPPHPIISLSSLRIDIFMFSFLYYTITTYYPSLSFGVSLVIFSYLSISIPSHVYMPTLISTRRYYTYTLIVPVASDIWNNFIFCL